jgi:hypothetical protein
MSATVPVERSAEAAELPLKNCPWCGYGVEGLPAVHACPECGTGVDRRWTIYGGATMPVGRVAALRTYVMVAGTLPLLLVMLLAGTPGGWRMRLIPMSLLMLVPLVVLAVIPLRPRRFLAVGPEGLVIALNVRKRKFMQVPWSEIESAQQYPLRKTFEIRRVGGKPIPLSAHQYFSVDMAEMDRFVREFNRYPRPGQ